MPRFLQIAVGAVLVLHGVIHMMGAYVYMGLGRIESLPYKTTLLGGRWDLGEHGTHLFGASWLVPLIGFCALGANLAVRGGLPVSALVAVTLFSLALTVLDWKVAYAGALLDGLILAASWGGPALATGGVR